MVPSTVVSPLSVSVKHGFLHIPTSDHDSDSRASTRASSCPPVTGSAPDASVDTSLTSSCVETSSGDDWSTSDASTPELAPYATTVMVRNIPTRFTSVSFLRVLDECGFAGTYSFVYLPMDFRTGKNMGYSFVNFIQPSVAQMFASIFHGTRLGLTTSTKVLHVSTSRRQGLKDNVALFRGSDLLSSFSLPFFKPFVLVWGELMPLCETLFDLIMASPDW